MTRPAKAPICASPPAASARSSATDDSWREGALAGGYWLREPGPAAEAAIVAMGAVMPEALAAWEELSEDVPGLGLLAVTSPDLLHRGWTAAQAARWKGERKPSHVEQLLSRARAGRRSRHPRRCRAGLAVLARRSPRPARRAARRREIRPDRQPRRPLRRLPPRRRRDHRGGCRAAAACHRSAAHGRALFRRVAGRRPGRARAHADRHRDRQPPDHHAHPQSAAAAPRL